MKTETLYRLANKNNIRIDFVRLPCAKSVTVMLAGQSFIGMDSETPSGSPDEKVCLAHELGHCQTGSLYNIYSPLDIRAKHEKRADRWAISKLVPKRKLALAIKNGSSDIPYLAEHFGVTEAFIKKAIDYYTEN